MVEASGDDGFSEVWEFRVTVVVALEVVEVCVY